MRPQALIFLGAPGAGKGTQAREVATEFSIPQISTGEILRDAVKKGTPLGQAAKAKMESGQLVPDEIVCGIVEERTNEPDCKPGFILDGFPRTIAQAEFVGRMLETKGRGEPLVVNIAVEQDVLMKRLTGRRTCSVCGEIYNVYFNPSRAEGICDKDGGKLTQRADDNEQSIRQRLVAYDNQTRPLIEYYREKSLLRDIDGNREPEPVTRDLINVLKSA